jgi:hypothetical protein
MLMPLLLPLLPLLPRMLLLPPTLLLPPLLLPLLLLLLLTMLRLLSDDDGLCAEPSPMKNTVSASNDWIVLLAAWAACACADGRAA